MNNALKIYLGSDRWGRKEWEGKIYPTNIRENERRKYYAAAFNFIEYRASHYKTDTIESIRPLLDDIKNKDFKFCPLLPIEYSKKCFDDSVTYKNEMMLSHEVYKSMGKQFGFSIFQMPLFNFTNEYPVLLIMIEQWPHDYSMALEMSEKNTGESMAGGLYQHLNTHSTGIVLTNKTYEFAEKLTSPYIYIRLHVTANLPRLSEIVNCLPSSAKELYICITGEPVKQHTVADVLMEYNEVLRKRNV